LPGYTPPPDPMRITPNSPPCQRNTRHGDLRLVSRVDRPAASNPDLCIALRSCYILHMPLILGSLTVALLVGELDALIRGRAVKGVYISDDRVLAISLRKHSSSGDPGDRAAAEVLRFLHAPGFALVCLDAQTENESALTHLPRFESVIRDSSITGVEQVDLDRIVKVNLRTRAGDAAGLYFELNPSLPNLFLTDGGENIRASLLKAGTRTRSRKLEAGKRYSPPPMPCRIDPSEITEKYVNTLNWWQDDTVLSQSVSGVSPFFSREVASRARTLGSFYKAYDGLLSIYRAGRASPYTFSAGGHAPGFPASPGIAWYEPEQESVRELDRARTFNEAALRILRKVTASRAFEKRKAAAVKAVRHEIRKLRKMEAETRGREAETRAGEELRKFGELLMANIDKIRKGDTRIVLPDLHSGGDARVAIELEPRLTPQANAKAYFKKARKALRRAQLAHDKLEKAKRRLPALEAVREELECISDPGRLTEIEKEIGRVAPAGAGGKPVEDDKALRLGIRPRKYEISGGWTVLVGRSARENDILTHRYASPGDLWFHARQAQGAHVVLRRGRKKAQPSRQAVWEAAAIAAYYSKARTSKHVPVSYTEKRYVKKVRKGPPGTAAMLREKVIFVDPLLPGREE
jgi:predicted ribosome quality control (RQC) complex YloA/Tae2 family protein